jgi:hypothetical protein
MPLFSLVAFALSFGPYTDMKIEGFTVRVETNELSDRTWKPVEQELKTQLYRIVHTVGQEPLKKLQSVMIWVHKDDKATKCMAYHPAKEWLSKHGSNPEMARAVEIANAEAFVSWTYEQPWMVLHELAHAYHHRFLDDGFGNKDVKSVWDAEMASKRYEQVLHWDGKQIKHYATTNQMEFFAECTEAYFGHNDFYPFVNAELKKFDPDAFSLMRQIWGTPEKRK